MTPDQTPATQQHANECLRCGVHLFSRAVTIFVDHRPLPETEALLCIDCGANGRNGMSAD